MKLIIVGHGRKFDEKTYLGTDRPVPSYVEGLGDEHGVNQAFFWYCDSIHEVGFVNDLDRAWDLVRKYEDIGASEQLEVLEVTSGDQIPETDSNEFLGFDLSAGFGYSLLSWGLEIDKFINEDLPEDDRIWEIFPLIHLVEAFFRLKLNKNGLFDEYAVARFCLECMMALQGIRANLWENEEVVFEVVGLWRIFPARC